MISSFVLRALAGTVRKHVVSGTGQALAGAVRKQVVSGTGLPISGKSAPRPYKPWLLWRAFFWGLGVAILFQAAHWAEIYNRFHTSSFVSAADDLIGRLDLLPVIFVLVAVARNAVMKRRRART